MHCSILLDLDNFECLRKSLPAESEAVSAVAQAGIFQPGKRFPNGAALIECSETEARALLSHAESHCPDSVPAISKAFGILKPFKLD
jgi:hypothetical protein